MLHAAYDVSFTYPSPVLPMLMSYRREVCVWKYIMYEQLNIQLKHTDKAVTPFTVSVNPWDLWAVYLEAFALSNFNYTFPCYSRQYCSFNCRSRNNIVLVKKARKYVYSSHKTVLCFINRMMLHRLKKKLWITKMLIKQYSFITIICFEH